MDIVHKIGQLFLLGFRGESIDPTHPVAEDISRRNLGGIVLFDRLLARKEDHNNIISASQVKALTSSLQGFARTPLFIGVDQEGGRVRRLKPDRGFPGTASAAELGQKNDRTLTAIHAATTAATLHAVGINFNLAPVVDINTFPENPVIGRLERSFSASPAIVSDHAAEWIKAHQTIGVLTCLKHFPGHGSSRTDSHLGFTDITGSWQDSELQPYKELIANGLAETIMTGHLFHKGLDPVYPATLSAAVITRLLRQKLQFTGLVISDDLQMKAITDQYGLEEAACLALAAGVDLLIIGNNLDDDPGVLARIIPAILRAIKSGRLAEQRINEAWERVQRVKRQFVRTVAQVT